MAVTRNSRSRQRGKLRNRRNPSRPSQGAISRPQRHPRLNYAESSSDTDEFPDTQSTSASEDNLAPGSTGSSSIANEAEGDGRPAKNILVSPSSAARNKSRKCHRTSEAKTQFGRKRGRTSVPRLRPRPGKRRKTKAPKVFSFDGHNPNTVIPDWRDPRMPFECWVDVFLYAARDGSSEVIATGWLLHAATTCKAFTEPALTAIYRFPPIRSTAKAKKLVLLLNRPTSETLFNYRAKINTLHVNIHNVPHGILLQLIHPLTRLKELIIYTPLDQAPYRDLDITNRWHYPEEVFNALEAGLSDSTTVSTKPSGAVLKSWEWSGRFIGGFVANFNTMAYIHQTPSFSQITRLSLTNIQVPSLKNLQIISEEKELQNYYEDGVVIASVANAISQLRALKHLIFESSTVMNDRLLPLLPKDLIHLELINCWEVKSEDLAAFLRTHASEMRTLNLMHNQSLNLAFLTELGETCPKLRELNMNLSYFRHHDCVNDADPMYDQALLPSQIPKWPSSLRIIDIEHIRDWSVETAEMFLQSIIDSASKMPELRHLAIKTMLDIPWQARANMRRKWRDKMEKVFLRPYVPPTKFTTLRAPVDGQEPTLENNKKSPESLTPPYRRNSRIAFSSELSESHRSSSKSMRIQRQKKPSYKEPDTDDDLFTEEEDEENDDNESSDKHSAAARHQSPVNSEAAPLFIQGKCTSVNISFDNQKIRELQYSMEDFGSEETDSEDEWNGDFEDEGNFVVF